MKFVLLLCACAAVSNVSVLSLEERNGHAGSKRFLASVANFFHHAAETVRDGVVDAAHSVAGAAETAAHAVAGAAETAAHLVAGAAETAAHSVAGAAETAVDKYVWLYSDVPQVLKGKHLSAVGSQKRGPYCLCPLYTIAGKYMFRRMPKMQ